MKNIFTAVYGIAFWIAIMLLLVNVANAVCPLYPLCPVHDGIALTMDTGNHTRRENGHTFALYFCPIDHEAFWVRCD